MSNPRAWLAVLLVSVGSYRLTLIDEGHFNWGDEDRFLSASDLVDAVANGAYRDAIVHLFEARRSVPPGRPGFVLVSTLPVAAQRATGVLMGIEADTPQYYDVASAFNVIVSLGITCCVFMLGRIWTGSPWFALLMAAVYSLLCNANVWIRHMVPYPESLLLGLLALWLVSARGGADSLCRVALAGLLTGLACACYPGHYAFVMINAAVVFVISDHRIAKLMTFGLGCTTTIAIFEALSGLVGRSYLEELQLLSGAINMGDPREGYVFVWHYLRDVEGIVGILLFGLFGVFILRILWRRNVRLSPAPRVAMLAAIGCYLFHASMGVFVGKMVFYGRILMVFLPFVVGGAVIVLAHIEPPRIRRWCVGALMAASMISFGQFASTYVRVVYPAEFLQKTMAGLGREILYPPSALWGMLNADPTATIERFDPELMMVADTRPEGSDTYVHLASHRVAHGQRPRFICVNLKYVGYVRDRYDRFVPPDGYALIAEAPHTELFPAGWYEGRKPWERRRIHERRYTMRIYERTDGGERVTSSYKMTPM